MYVQDQVVADLQNLAGGYAPHGTYVNLYLDGVYWGIYYVHERPDDSFAAAYLGGDKEDYDVIKHNPTYACRTIARRPSRTTQRCSRPFART